MVCQSFTGKGMLPAEILCVTEDDISEAEAYTAMSTITGKESFFMQEGYLIVSLEIRVKSNQGMWYEFKNWSQTEIAEDAVAAGWNYVPGDIIRYDLSKSIRDDYEIGGME